MQRNAVSKVPLRRRYAAGPDGTSDRHGGGVIGVEPFHAFAHALLLPFARDLDRDLAWIGQRRTEGGLAVLVGFAHHRGGALASDVLVTREGGRGIVEVLGQVTQAQAGFLELLQERFISRWFVVRSFHHNPQQQRG